VTARGIPWGGQLGMLIPSRGRPHNAARLWNAMKATCGSRTTLILGLDADDPALDQYPAGPAYVIQDGLRYVTAWVNHLAIATYGRFEFIGHFGDDNEPVTPGWDDRVRKSLGTHLFCFADDQYPTRPPGSLSCHIFMRAEVVKTLGYMGPPEISHMLVDVAWYAWFLATGGEFLADVKIPHRHYTTGAPHDETYARSWAQTADNHRAWHAYSRREGPGGLGDDIIKLGGQPFTADRLAQFNRDLNIPEVWPW